MIIIGFLFMREGIMKVIFIILEKRIYIDKIYYY